MPVNAAARALPGERTIRFYVARGLVSPPEGRGTAATYGYRHLLQVLAIKLRQMEGATLESLAQGTGGAGGRHAGATRRQRAGAGPADAGARAGRTPGTHEPRGRVARAMQSALPSPGQPPQPTTCRRVPCGPGVELLLDERHPALQLPGAEAALARDIARLLDQAGTGLPSAS